MAEFDPNNGYDGYIAEQMKGIMARLSLSCSDAEELKRLFKLASDFEERFTRDGETPQVFMPTAETSKALVSYFMWRLIRSCSVENGEYFRKAIEFHRTGGNVVIVSNHTGGIDAPAVDHVLGIFFGKAYLDLNRTWIAGKRIWDSKFLRMFSRCVDLLTMFGEKYVQSAVGTEAFSDMRRRNTAMLNCMRNQGRRSLWFSYPSGTWSNLGQLMHGRPEFMDLLKSFGDKGERTIVLPAYLDGLDGPRGIVPPSPEQLAGQDGFYDFLRMIRPGSVAMRFGSPLSGSKLYGMPNEQGIDAVMHAIADLAPTEEARGPYARYLRKK